MSNYADGLHKTVVEGSIVPGPLVIYQKAYDTESYYGPPVKIADMNVEMQKQAVGPHRLGDESSHDIHKALHRLLSGKLHLTENRQLLSDRQLRG